MVNVHYHIDLYVLLSVGVFINVVRSGAIWSVVNQKLSFTMISIKTVTTTDY